MFMVYSLTWPHPSYIRVSKKMLHTSPLCHVITQLLDATRRLRVCPVRSHNLFLLLFYHFSTPIYLRPPSYSVRGCRGVYRNKLDPSCTDWRATRNLPDLLLLRSLITSADGVFLGSIILRKHQKKTSVSRAPSSGRDLELRPHVESNRTSKPPGDVARIKILRQQDSRLIFCYTCDRC